MSEAAHRWRVGVRDLARFALRRGDLERAPAGPDAHAGSRAHRRLQQQSGLEAEVALSRRARVAGSTVTVSGRMDLRDLAGQRLIEIKSTLVPLERLPPGRRALDRAQLELYAWLQAAEAGDTAAPVAPIAVLELHYFNLRTDAVQRECWAVEMPRIERTVCRALELWLAFQHTLRRRRERRYRSLDALTFPLGGFRPGQRRLSAGVYRSIENRVALLLEAPTGTGKTLGVLYPAVRAMHPTGAQRLIWLTAKTSGRDAVFDALRQLGDGGLHIDALLMRSQRDGCFCERDPALRDDSGECPFAQGFHDRLPGARQAAVEGETGTTLLQGPQLDALATEHRVCPHALAKELLPWASVVVCDYNHLLDPIAALPALGEAMEHSVVLIDEAHNVPERARQMFCASLSKLDVLAARTATQSSQPDLSRALQRVCNAMQALSRRSTGASGPDHQGFDAVSPDAPQALLRTVQGVLESLAAGREQPSAQRPPGQGRRVSDPALPVGLLHALHRFAVIGERFSAAHRCLLQRRRAGRRMECRIELACLDARVELGRLLIPARATVAFSAVLGPMEEFRDALGLPAASTVGIRGDSPFDAGQLLCQIIDWVPVRYAQRDTALQALVRLIALTVDAREGHYLVFLPSYVWIAQLAEGFTLARPEFEVWCQTRDAGHTETAGRLARLERAGTTIGFVITGGVYGEGIDYVGDRLIGAIVVGTALARRDALADLMIEHHESLTRQGYDIVFRHPALVRVLQSGGRVIRTPQDKGVLLLVDERFDDVFQRRCRPAHWQVQRPVGELALRTALQRFWVPAAQAGTSDERF